MLPAIPDQKESSGEKRKAESGKRKPEHGRKMLGRVGPGWDEEPSNLIFLPSFFRFRFPLSAFRFSPGMSQSRAHV
jgi:hypothetical protein